MLLRVGVLSEPGALRAAVVALFFFFEWPLVSDRGGDGRAALSGVVAVVALFLLPPPP